MLHTNKFIRQVCFRQDENRKSFYLLYDNKIYGVCISLLRQELDTLIKLCYLTHENTTENERNRLMEMSLSGEHWNRITQNGKYKPLTDRDMLNLASDLGGWENIVYKFGCKLIHLSNFHSYCENDPFLHMPHEEKSEIVKYIASYHGWSDGEITFPKLIKFLPNIFDKISSNIECFKEYLLSGDRYQ